MGGWRPPQTDPPARGPLVDTFGRVAEDLRISVTDRCNFRCTYCMPAEGLAWLPKEELLTFEELARLLRIFVSLGVRSVKITGGEPTVRAGLPKLVGMLREVAPDADLSMTTNGVLLDRLAEPLARAGLDRVTVSCDSLLRHRFAEMTRRDALERVLAGIRAAERAGLTPIKINCVVIAGQNEDEVVDFARWARETGYEVRFIEYMPLDAQRRWERAKVVPSARIVEAIDRVFCDTCDRLRLTAEGQLRACLFALEETDLRGPMRAGADDAELEALIRRTVWRKWSGHRIDHPDFVQPARSMSMIGG